MYKKVRNPKESKYLRELKIFVKHILFSNVKYIFYSDTSRHANINLSCFNDKITVN